MQPEQRDRLFQSALIFCDSHILETIQTSPFRPFDDSKSFVDLPLKRSPCDILESFRTLDSSPTREQYLLFLKTNFYCNQKEELSIYVQEHQPLDYNEAVPSFLLNVKSCPAKVISFCSDLKRRWKHLCRTFRPGVSTALLNRTSLIHLPHQFFIPGGRFRECYYWDTLWVMKGLVASDMPISARAACRNLFHLVERFGFVPNGNRLYYLNRTQPPVLTEAVRVVYEALTSKDDKIQWLQEATPLLDKELMFFHHHRAVSIVHPQSSFSDRFLCVYSALTNEPRPESYLEDIQTAELNKARDKKEIFHNLASAAESGWDFSSRWYTPESSLAHIRTDKIVPICLNSWLVHSERTLFDFYTVLADANMVNMDREHCKDRAQFFRNASEKRSLDMTALCWNRDNGEWSDFDLDSGSRTPIISAAAVMPMWAGCARQEWTSRDATNFVKFISHKSGLLQPGGIAITTTKSNQQWDFPNCWSPLVELAVVALQKVEADFPGSGAGSVARKLALRFVQTVFRGWDRNTGVIHEKYDSTSSTGERGVGGEYEPQTGFGWTNGTVLCLMKYFCDDQEFFQLE